VATVPVDIMAVMGGIGTLVGSAMWAYKSKKEREARKKGLIGNPARCEDHEKRLRIVEEQVTRFDERSIATQADISEIKNDVKSLLSRA